MRHHWVVRFSISRLAACLVVIDATSVGHRRYQEEPPLAQRKIRNEKPEIRNEYTQYVFREANTYQIRTKYVLRISIFVAYLRFEIGKIRIAYFSLG